MTVLLCCLLAISVLLATVAAFPEKAEAADKYESFTLDSGNAYMTGICEEGRKPSGDIVIPKTFTYNGVKYKVTKIGESAFYENITITSVEIPSSVTEIGKNAFYECSKMTSVKIPSSVKKIGDYAFQYCAALKTVDISKKAKLKSIGESAFDSCMALEKIYINAKKIGDFAFYGCTRLKKVTFGDNVEEIGQMAFRMTAITNIEFGGNIKKIGSAVMDSCVYLEKMTIGENVTTLGDWLDSGCKRLKTIIVKSTKLEAKNCGETYENGWYNPPFRNWYAKDYIKETIWVPKSKLSDYKKFLADKSVTYKTNAK
jgi:hypothetical protein